MDFSLQGGLSLDTDSLETIARGGISFLTVSEQGVKATPGQVFTLHKQADDQWLDQANQLRLPTVDLKGAVTLLIKTSQFGLLGSREVTRLCSAIPVVLESGQKGLVLPRNILTEFASETPTAKSISMDGFLNEAFGGALFGSLVALANEDQASDSTLPVLMLPLEGSIRLPWLPLASSEIDKQRVLAVRRPVGGPAGMFVHRPINAEQLTDGGDGHWKVASFDGDQDLWNGSPILSADTGDVIGAMVSDARGVKIVPLSQLLK